MAIAQAQPFIVVFVILWLPLTSSQSVAIATGSPKEGAGLELECLIVGYDMTGTSAFVWAKDDQNIIWIQDGVEPDLEQTGDYTSRDYYDDAAGTYHFILTIGQYSSRYDGLYKCFIAEGNTVSYVEIASEIRYVSIGFTNSTDMTMIIPTVNISGSEIPTCIPNNDFRERIYTNTTIKCVASTTPTNLISGMNIQVYDSSGNLVPTVLHTIDNTYERTHTFNVMPEDHDITYQC